MNTEIMLNIGKTISLTTALIFGVTACGDGKYTAGEPKKMAQANLVSANENLQKESPTEENNVTLTVSGKVLNVGYLANAQVCLDENDNGNCDNNEPIGITDSDGNYSLVIKVGARGANLLAIVTPDSVDSASTAEMPVVINHGWVLPVLLEYDDKVTDVRQNITFIAATYTARQRTRGRSRDSNLLNTFRRVVGEPNIDFTTGQYFLPVDFDHVASPKNNLSDRLYDFYKVLNERTLVDNTSLSALDVTAYAYALYNAYSNASDDAALQPSMPSRIVEDEIAGEDFIGDFADEDHRYFRSRTDVITVLRNGLTETTGWVRSAYNSTLEQIGRRVIDLQNGQVVLHFEERTSGYWQPLTVSEDVTFTLSPEGNLTTIGATDSQQPRVISHVDGNRVTLRMPGNNSRAAYDVANSPATNFFIEEWVDEQQSINWFYGENLPEVPAFTERPGCAKNYPGYRHQPNTGRDSLSDWYRQCFDYFTAEYYAEILADIDLTYENPEIPGATFYDVTLLDPIVIFPATEACGNDDNPLARITVGDIEHCNWAIDTMAGHTLENIFDDDGIRIHSWNNIYGESDFDVDGSVIIAGDESQWGQPQQLKLTLNREGNSQRGTGSIYSQYGGWTPVSIAPLTEDVIWEISPMNPNLILVEFPFLDVNNPLVPSGSQSDGATAAMSPAIFSGARLSDRSRSSHFTSTWNNTSFRMDQSTHSSINREKIAIYLSENGHVLTGQYYGAGFTFSERYFVVPAFEQGVKALEYVVDNLFSEGWIDSKPLPAMSQ